MKFLLTGITGFVGSHLARKIASSGHNVIGVTRSGSDVDDVISFLHPYNENVAFYYSDLTDEKTIEQLFVNHKFDGVFHLGALTHPPTSFLEPKKTMLINAMATAHICDTTIKYCPEAKFMYCSTSEVYGVYPEGTRIYETTEPKPMNPYGVAKYAGELYVRERMRNAGLKGFITRSFSHTGPRRRSNYSISSDAIQIARILKDKQEPVISVGNLSCKRTVIDVRDVVEAYWMLMNISVNNGEIFNIAGIDLREMGYFLDKMISSSGISATTKIDEKLYRKIDIPIQYPDSTKIRSLGWSPKIPIETTLKDLVDYWMERV